MTIQVRFEEEERQAILLALAQLAALRPGWDDLLGGIAERFNGRTMYQQFLAMRRDVVGKVSPADVIDDGELATIIRAQPGVDPREGGE